jgi:hypothetical protein
MVSLAYSSYARVMLGQYIHPALHFIVCQLSQTCANMVSLIYCPYMLRQYIQPRHPFIRTSSKSNVPLWHASLTANMLGRYFQPRRPFIRIQLSQMCPHGKPR